MIVSKKISDEKMLLLKNTFIKKSQIDTILTKDTIVHTEDGKLLLVFKKITLMKPAPMLNLFFLRLWRRPIIFFIWL